MKRPDLSRYDDDQLDRMLYSYRTLARSHLEQGHYALAKWATRMVTWITVEMNARHAAAEAANDSQMMLNEILADHGVGDAAA